MGVKEFVSFFKLYNCLKKKKKYRCNEEGGGKPRNPPCSRMPEEYRECVRADGTGDTPSTVNYNNIMSDRNIHS